MDGRGGPDLLNTCYLTVLLHGLTEIKFDPLSVSNSSGIPVLAGFSIRKFTTV